MTLHDHLLMRNNTHEHILIAIQREHGRTACLSPTISERMTCISSILVPCICIRAWLHALPPQASSSPPTASAAQDSEATAACALALCRLRRCWLLGGDGARDVATAAGAPPVALALVGLGEDEAGTAAVGGGGDADGDGVATAGLDAV